MGLQVRMCSLWVKIRWLFSYFVPVFHACNVFLLGMSEHHCNEAREPIVEVIGLNDASRGLLYTWSWNATIPYFAPYLPKWVSMHFQRWYAWLNVWHKISQQQCEISCWCQKTTYRKLWYIASPMVAWLMMSRCPLKVKVMTPKYLKLHVSEAVRDRQSVQIDYL